MTTNSMSKCICEHVEAHHRQSGPLNPLSLTRCEWSGCGCPRFIVMPEIETSVVKTTRVVMTKEYKLIKEGTVINGRLVEVALKWLDSPIPIYSPDFMQTLGSIKSIRREDGVLYGTSYDFCEDVNLSLEITHIEVKYEAKHDDRPRIIEGLIRAAVVTRDSYVRAE